MNLSNPQELLTFLGSRGIKADKSLGQHFLCSATIVKAISGAVGESNGILEIGPGPGVLTSALATRPKRVLAIELDPKMVDLLATSAPNAKVVHSDALKADLPGLLTSLEEPRSIVGNLPYYITGALLTRIAEAKSGFSNAVLMMQKEVADRVAAPPGDSARGSLSVYLQANFRMERIAHVPPDSFIPPPKVESTVLKLTKVEGEISEDFFSFVRACFSQPRKTLANNMSFHLRLEKAQVLGIIRGAGLGATVRPHMVTMEEWVRLFESLR